MSIWKVSLWKSIENVLIEMFTNVSWKVPKNGFEMINVEMHLKKKQMKPFDVYVMF